MSKFSGILKKLKSIKHIEIILAVLLGLIILLVYFSSTGSASTTKTPHITTQTNTYLSEVENKLENLISNISGVGKVSVMVMGDTNDEDDETPKILSAVVVATGANDAFVKLEIIKACEALLQIKASNIEVLVGNQ